ncbi:MAG TPA: glycerol-3-phosphate 1-O-acyltransferase PlsY [Pyrinomonadaceae bacterium]|nr:glycerol-3-phosphate 1-O-acyltransferase PlsY [Pyrinomonadaceae bacterium]
MRPAAVILIAYLLGSIPFGYLIVRSSKRADIRETGSGGTGATNVSRRAGKAAGVLTLVLDALKGAAAVVIAKLALGLPIFAASGGPSLAQAANSSVAIENVYWWVAAAAIAAIVGHIFPVWLGFRGGKGVATGVGVFLVLAPLAVVFAAVLFLVIVLLTRYVSLGAIVAAATIPVLVLIQNYISPHVEFWPLMTAAIVGAALIIFAHRENIARLIHRTESKFE